MGGAQETARGVTRAASTERTRAAILAAARTLFVEQGYRATSLREIATAAGISVAGLQRHFATKDVLLIAVLDAVERRETPELLDRLAEDRSGGLHYATIARWNATVPGYAALYAALTGEASTATHPAHASMRSRYDALRRRVAGELSDAIRRGVVDAARDPEGEAVRLIAAWDGLQLLQQYLPRRVDVVERLEAHQVLLTAPPGGAERRGDRPADPAALPREPVRSEAASAGGYRPGRERRSRILADAMALFARDGYGDTSLREVADRVGVAKTTLLHHYPSKEALLGAVLVERDRAVQAAAAADDADRAAEVVRAIPRGAAANSVSEPGLIQVHAVLSCEAVPIGHPAHEYFVHRFASGLDYFRDLFAGARSDGELGVGRDPEHEAIWLVALWEGLQYQWLYDRGAVDVGAQLDAHLADVVPRPADAFPALD